MEYIDIEDLLNTKTIHEACCVHPHCFPCEHGHFSKHVHLNGSTVWMQVNWSYLTTTQITYSVNQWHGPWTQSECSPCPCWDIFGAETKSAISQLPHCELHRPNMIKLIRISTLWEGGCWIDWMWQNTILPTKITPEQLWNCQWSNSATIESS